MYLIEQTVEKSIYEISVERRMGHIARSQAEGKGKAKEAEVLERQIEVANTAELQEASLSQLFTKGSGGGENVNKEDVWECLFRHRPRSNGQVSAEAEGEIGRQLRATAGRERQVDTFIAE